MTDDNQSAISVFLQKKKKELETKYAHTFSNIYPDHLEWANIDDAFNVSNNDREDEKNAISMK